MVTALVTMQLVKVVERASMMIIPSVAPHIEDGCERARVDSLILENRRIAIRDLSAALGLPLGLHTTGP